MRVRAVLGSGGRLGVKKRMKLTTHFETREADSNQSSNIGATTTLKMLESDDDDDEDNLFDTEEETMAMAMAMTRILHPPSPSPQRPLPPSALPSIAPASSGARPPAPQSRCPGSSGGVSG